MSRHLRYRLLLAALFLAAPFASWCEDGENPDAALARISSLFKTHNPLGTKFFTDYYWVFQGNPVGGLSQDFAYSQYLIFGVKLKEPLGWRGGSFKISAVSAGGLNAIPVALGLNSSFTESSSASWAAGARWHQTEEIYLSAGIAQASAALADGSTYHGLDLGFRGDEGILAVAEAGWTSNPENSDSEQSIANARKNWGSVCIFS